MPSRRRVLPASARTSVVLSILRGTPSLTVASMRGCTVAAVDEAQADRARAGLTASAFPFTEEVLDNGRRTFAVKAAAFPID